MWLGDGLDSIFNSVTVDNLDKDIGGLFLLILDNDRHDRIVGQLLIEEKRFIVLDATERWFRFIFFYGGTCG
jgi:hypothetical protein